MNCLYSHDNFHSTHSRSYNILFLAFNLPQHYEFVSHWPALRILKEVIETVMLKSESLAAYRASSTQPDVLFQVFLG
jgi:hypothetical protein